MHSHGTSRVHMSSGINVSHLTHIYCGHPTECPFNPCWKLTDFTVLTWSLGLTWSGLEHSELDSSGLEMVRVSLHGSCMHLLPKTGPFRYQNTEQQLISTTRSSIFAHGWKLKDKLSHGQDGEISLEWSLKCSMAQLWVTSTSWL